MTEHRYVTLDVFCEVRFAGNPLAVVWDADGLDEMAMLAVAREFGFSETVFLQQPTQASCDVRTRIFTPGGELPFAGHPTIGTAVALGRDQGETTLVFDQLAGPVPVVVDGTSASFLVERDVSVGPADEVSREVIAGALDLPVADLAGGGRIVSAGTPFLVVEVASLDALARARVVDTPSPDGLYVVCRTGDRSWRVRMFAPHLGVEEDPATGAAATAFGGLLATMEPDGEVSWTIEQGVEMGRPSRIGVTADVAGGRARWLRVSGGAVVVCEGTLHLDD
jgi:trans-2,3-dihydro-3-hydroxyanthranilate isomerase